MNKKYYFYIALGIIVIATAVYFILKRKNKAKEKAQLEGMHYKPYYMSGSSDIYNDIVSSNSKPSYTSIFGKNWRDNVMQYSTGRNNAGNNTPLTYTNIKGNFSKPVASSASKTQVSESINLNTNIENASASRNL